MSEFVPLLCSGLFPKPKLSACSAVAKWNVFQSGLLTAPLKEEWEGSLDPQQGI